MLKVYDKQGNPYNLIEVGETNINPACNSLFRHADITKYITDGTMWSRIAGTNGFKQYDDIYVGDYIRMSRAITVPGSYNGRTGTDIAMVAGCGTLMGNGDSGVDYPHLIMVAGNMDSAQHFGRAAMNTSHTTAGGYKGSRMHTTLLGSVVSSGSTASGATINQQLYAEFGNHLKTTRELLTNSVGTTLTNRFGSAGGASNNWEWVSCQACLMSEVEVYGGTVFSSSGFDTGSANHQLPAFRLSTKVQNNGTAYYWLKDVASASAFCYSRYHGYAYCFDAGHADYFVRPRFVIA